MEIITSFFCLLSTWMLKGCFTTYSCLNENFIIFSASSIYFGSKRCLHVHIKDCSMIMIINIFQFNEETQSINNDQIYIKHCICNHHLLMLQIHTIKKKNWRTKMCWFRYQLVLSNIYRHLIKLLSYRRGCDAPNKINMQYELISSHYCPFLLVLE